MVHACFGAFEGKAVASEVQLVCLAATHLRGWVVILKAGGEPV